MQRRTGIAGGLCLLWNINWRVNKAIVDRAIGQIAALYDADSDVSESARLHVDSDLICLRNIKDMLKAIV